MSTQKEQRLLRHLMNLKGHLITFKVRTPGSHTGQLVQTPILMLKDVSGTSAGRVCLRGIDVKKVNSPDYVEEGERNYRLDRIVGQVYDLGRVVDSPYTYQTSDDQGYVSF